MNVLALLLALVGAGLSIFQPNMRLYGWSYFDGLSGSVPSLFVSGVFVLIMAVAAVVCGYIAFTRKNEGKNHIAGLFICGGLCILGCIEREQFFLWALCYFAAGLCAAFDSKKQHQ